MTEEEKNASISAIRFTVNLFKSHSAWTSEFNDILEELKEIIEYKNDNYKSIQDLQREAFEAGRSYLNMNVYNGYKFETFNDYLKTLQNE